MSIIEQFKQGKINKEQLAEAMQKHPELKDQVQALLDGELNLDDLDKIAGGATWVSYTPADLEDGPPTVQTDMW